MNEEGKEATEGCEVASPGAVHVPATEGETVWMAGDTYTIKATGAMTGGALSFVEATVPPGAGPRPHIHHREDEAYYVLSGELEVLDGERTFIAGPGDFVFIPRGTVHRFKNVGVHTAKMVFLFTPAGFEEFFLEAGYPARPGEPAPAVRGVAERDRVAEIASRYAWSPAPG
ncbi:cupin domain-containing protein [Nocardiopsis alba]|uniref:Cupin domain-containing protein n=1 Tax=Nocardiopsis alba TaxID=53437 RepID=A0A7K2IZY5_9ACTN|nr:quercetin 2,3-dioxygenase [Nocardiopsis alba]MYR35552.1 cupin domain-containing protein [Nocardiopsis alba]